VRRIYVLTQYLSESLTRHIQDGWSISSSGLGDFVYSIPAQQKMGAIWYRGTADAVRQNLNLINERDTQDVLILSGDHVYKMNYLQALSFHRQHEASLTISAIRVRKEEAAGRLGVLEVDPDYRLVSFEEKPPQPRTLPGAPDYAMASMGIYIFKVSALLDVLQGEGQDFGKHIIPNMLSQQKTIFVYDFAQENRICDYEIWVQSGIRQKVVIDRTRDSTYWRDVGTVDSFFEASMELITVDPPFSLYGELWPLRTHQRQLPPSKCILDGKIINSIISDGCIISGGTIEQSILSPGVIVERGANINQSVVFDYAYIEPGARINRAVIDKECRIRSGASLGYDHEKDKSRGCSISPEGIVVAPKGTDIHSE
jgi:glucose-1-phosphate adenylyltransferase